ncbi:MAG TPA: hypothetical protein PKD37_04890 [Oligoflexia bacterium]|nr:hypothetical protein [Oligoflexia bacterium]HMP27302.1 hypothetical protein [Oligoflexia bacterium]
MSSNRKKVKAAQKKAQKRANRAREMKKRILQTNAHTKVCTVHELGQLFAGGHIARLAPDGEFSYLTELISDGNPFYRSIDKTDEANALLFDHDQNPDRYQSTDLQSLIEEIRLTKNEMDKIVQQAETPTSENDRTALEEAFAENRKRNYSAINELAKKAFGGIGVGKSSRFGRMIIRYLAVAMPLTPTTKVPVKIITGFNFK